MEPQTIRFGDPQQHAEFLQEYRAFLIEWKILQETVKTVMLGRVINPTIKADAEAVAHLPDDDPLVIAVEDRYKANLASFILARNAVDDFSELLILAANGFGVGALKTLRGMYERVVTSAYVALYPEVSRALVDNTYTQSWRVWKRAVALNPAIADLVDETDVKALEAKAAEAQVRHHESYCKKCGQLIQVYAWTKVDLATMAKMIDDRLSELSIGHSKLSDLYLNCYLHPTAFEHATGTSVNSRMEEEDGQWTYRMGSTSERKQAMLFGHTLLLLLLGRQSQHFGFDLDDLLQPRFDAYKAIWGASQATTSQSI
jgi:hypothetical protein